MCVILITVGNVIAISMDIRDRVEAHDNDVLVVPFDLLAKKNALGGITLGDLHVFFIASMNLHKLFLI